MPVTVIVDAYGNPRTAAKFEDMIGDLMLRNERSGGHSRNVPENVHKMSEEAKKYAREPNFNEKSIISALKKIAIERKRYWVRNVTVAFAANCSQKTSHKVLSRLCSQGRVTKKMVGSHLEYKLNDDQ